MPKQDTNESPPLSRETMWATHKSNKHPLSDAELIESVKKFGNLLDELDDVKLRKIYANNLTLSVGGPSKFMTFKEEVYAYKDELDSIVSSYGQTAGKNP